METIPSSNMIRNTEFLKQQSKSTASNILIGGCIVAFLVIVVIGISDSKKQKKKDTLAVANKPTAIQEGSSA